MREKLKWDVIGFAKKTQILLEHIQKEKVLISGDHINKHPKLQRYLDELNHLKERMEKIEKIFIPILEQTFHLEFPTPELIMFSLFRPSVRNVFEDLGKHFLEDIKYPLKQEEFMLLESFGDAANVLALIGESALSLAVVQLLRDYSLYKARDITAKKHVVMSDENLSKYCDQWGLNNWRLRNSKILNSNFTCY